MSIANVQFESTNLLVRNELLAAYTSLRRIAAIISSSDELIKELNPYYVPAARNVEISDDFDTWMASLQADYDTTIEDFQAGNGRK